MRNLEKILIIDNDETAVIYLSMFLAENDFYIISARNGKEGLEKALTEKPCIIILGMSEESEVTAMRKLQVNKDTKQIPIIITGATPFFRRFFKLKEQFGMVKDYIEKPIDRELLLKKVKELLTHVTH